MKGELFVKNDVLVSIVVPVYNVEKYLMRCYDSIVSQTYENWEVIFVDDGSTDDSGKMCDEIAKKDKRIKVVHKKNEGLGLARNHGVRLCNGEYIFFVDSDDYIEKDAIESLLKIAAEYHCDLVIGNEYYQEDAMDLPIHEGLYQKNEIVKEILPRIIGSNPGKADQLTPSSCGNLYMRKLFFDSDLWFPSERLLIWEDLAFNFEYFQKCESIYLTERPVYDYCFNGESLTHKYDADKLSKIIKMYQYMKKRIEDTNMTDVIGDRLENSFMGHIRTCIKLEVYYSSTNGKKYTRSQIRKICENKIVKKIASIALSPLTVAQRIYNFCIIHGFINSIYFLTWIQNKRKGIV